LPSVDPRAAQIIKLIVEFEASVADAETAFLARNWGRVDALLSTQHRLTHGLRNALEETAGERPQSFTDEVDRRIGGISERRADQLQRLIAFNHLVKERLTMIARSREMRRGSAATRPRARILDTLQ
jgi:hypothetical protein